jgi:hypothetical protein
MATILFALGQTVATPGALSAFEANHQTPDEFIRRHQNGDWGDVPEEDKKENELSLREGFRILSAYRLNDQTRIWIITEADRSSTCVLLPEEY